MCKATGRGGQCDRSLVKARYRFTGSASNKMADTLAPKYHCGARAPGYLNGGHRPQELSLVDGVSSSPITTVAGLLTSGLAAVKLFYV